MLLYQFCGAYATKTVGVIDISIISQVIEQWHLETAVENVFRIRTID